MKDRLPDYIGYVAPEIVSQTSEYATNAFNQRQKEWIRDRDDNQCQFPVVVKPASYVPCGRTDHLQVHHAIVPQRFGKEHGFRQEDLDVAENGLTLCESHHNGVIHNDMLVARLAYGKDKTSFAQAFDKRGDKIEEGVPYWNTEFDGLFERIITARNQKMPDNFPLTNRQVRAFMDLGQIPIPSVVERNKLLK